MNSRTDPFQLTIIEGDYRQLISHNDCFSSDCMDGCLFTVGGEERRVQHFLLMHKRARGGKWFLGGLHWPTNHCPSRYRGRFIYFICRLADTVAANIRKWRFYYLCAPTNYVFRCDLRGWMGYLFIYIWNSLMESESYRLDSSVQEEILSVWLGFFTTFCEFIIWHFSGG